MACKKKTKDNIHLEKYAEEEELSAYTQHACVQWSFFCFGFRSGNNEGKISDFSTNSGCLRAGSCFLSYMQQNLTISVN